MCFKTEITQRPGSDCVGFDQRERERERERDGDKTAQSLSYRNAPVEKRREMSFHVFSHRVSNSGTHVLTSREIFRLPLSFRTCVQRSTVSIESTTKCWTRAASIGLCEWANGTGEKAWAHAGHTTRKARNAEPKAHHIANSIIPTRPRPSRRREERPSRDEE